MLFSPRSPYGSRVSHQIQGHFLQSLPAARAIQQYASWRTVIAYRATLDVPRELAWFAAKLLLAERRRRGTPRGSRALSCFWQAVLGLRWFRDRTAAESLARDHGISRATAYRYLDEVITVLAQQAPDLHRALERAKDEGLSHVILDGKIIPADRCKEPAVSVKGEVIDLWYSGKAQRR
jgi:hypothetical protein